MKGNRIPREESPFLALADQMIHGLQALQGELEITVTSANEMRALRDACTDGETAVGVAKATKAKAATALQAADEAATAFLMQARKILTCHLGNRWSAQWAPTGFPDESTKIPKRQTQRWNLCASLQLYFAAYPGQEVPAFGVTAAKAQENFEAIRHAHTQLARATTDLGQKLKVRDAAFEQLKLDLHSCIESLPITLPDDDPRWHRFGLNPPADPHVPERVESLVLQQKGPDAIEVHWERAPRATRYRPFVQVVGKDAEPKARPPAYDPRIYLTGFSPGDTIRIQILAANATGEAAPSPTAEITMK